MTLETCPMQGKQDFYQSDDKFALNQVMMVNSLIADLGQISQQQTLERMRDNLFDELTKYPRNSSKVDYHFDFKDPKNLLHVCLCVYASAKHGHIKKQMLESNMRGIEWLVTSFVYCIRYLKTLGYEELIYKQDKPLWRGVTDIGVKQHYPVGAILSWPNFTSTSKCIDVAKNFATCEGLVEGVIFKIHV